MRNHGVFSVFSAVLCGSLLFAAPASAQVAVQPTAPIVTGSVRETSGSAGARAPGNLVGAGVGRALNRAPRPLAVPEITEQAPPPSVRSQVIATVLDAFFADFNNALSAFMDLLLVRAGGQPVNTLNTVTGGAAGSGGLGGLLSQFSSFL